MNSVFELEARANACRSCGATVQQHDCGRERFLDAGQHLFYCGICGLAYLASDFTDAALNEFYARHYRRLFLFDATKEHDETFFTHTLYREGARARATLVAAQVPMGGRVFEIGSGFGTFLGALHKLRPDIQLYATEIDREHRTMQLFGAPVTFLEPQELVRQDRFDAVVGFHVVEHLKQPVKDIRQYLAALKPSGVLMVEVPDASGDWGSWFYIQPAHLSYFTKESMTRMFQRAGGAISHVGTHPGGAAFTQMLWAVVMPGTGEAAVIAPATDEENQRFMAHIMQYRYNGTQALKKRLKQLLVAIVGPEAIGARQRRKVYAAQRHLYDQA